MTWKEAHYFVLGTGMTKCLQKLFIEGSDDVNKFLHHLQKPAKPKAVEKYNTKNDYDREPLRKNIH